ncbi:MAG: hypothetical protein ACMZI0_15735 [Symbiopectobacterium sp.]|uniref:hypothetical protein n=1 Tax=Symbiopectobacterium sp. TaxID=2952789 RepID=UPI0039EADF03
MSHSITQPNRGDFCYSDFRLFDKHSDSNDICRITSNKNGDMCLSSAYSLKERFIQFLSYIPLVSRMDFVSKQIGLIKKEQADAVTVFLRVLRDEFDRNSFHSETQRHENRPDYLKCKNISIWLNSAANSTVSQSECQDINDENLMNLKYGLSTAFNGLSSESLDCLVENETRDQYADVIVSKINTLLQKAKVPENLHACLRGAILEHLNFNALDSKHSLKSISDFICDFMNVSHMASGRVSSRGNPFIISDDILLVMDRIKTQTGFTSAGTVLAGVADLKAEIQSERLLKNVMRSSLHAYTMKNTYMYSLLAPAISRQPEDGKMPSSSSAPPSPPAPPSMPLAPSAPPPMLGTPLLTPLFRATASTKPKAPIENKPVTHRVENTGFINSDDFISKLKKRREAIDGEHHDEIKYNETITNKFKGESNDSNNQNILAIMKRKFDSEYSFRGASDSISSDDSGLNTSSNRSSIAGDSQWDE